MTRSIAFIAACAVLMSAANVFAAIITLPTILNPGDNYRLAFVTSGTRDASSSNIADYNTFVTNAANAVSELASLGTTWTAFGSTMTVGARDNTNTVPSTVTGGSLGVPIFLLNDTKLVDSNDDLWDGSIDLPFNRSEMDTVVTANTWTGTRSDGSIALQPLGTAEPLFGLSGSTGASWISSSPDFSNKSLHFYAVSDTLVIPEPASCTLLFTALGAVGVMYRGRKQKVAHRC